MLENVTQANFQWAPECMSVCHWTSSCITIHCT